MIGSMNITLKSLKKPCVFIRPKLKEETEMRFEELLAELSAEDRAEITRRSSELMRKFPLAKLRDFLGVAQADIAARLGVSQAAVSKMEGRSDIKLSSMWKYAESLGGAVSVQICFSHQRFDIEKDAEGDFTLRKNSIRPFRLYAVHSSPQDFSEPLTSAPAVRGQKTYQVTENGRAFA